MRSFLAIMMMLAVSFASVLSVHADGMPSHQHGHPMEMTTPELSNAGGHTDHRLHMAAEAACSISCIALPAGIIPASEPLGLDRKRFPVDHSGPVDGALRLHERPPRA